MKRALALVVLCLAAPAGAQPADPPAAPPPEAPTEPVAPPVEEPPPATPDANAEADARMQALEARLQKVEEDLDLAKDDNTFLEEKVAALAPLSGKIGGYLDFGFFTTTGNGAGTRSDLAQTYFPEYINKVPGSWVFMGDPLSTTINSRGDVADTGESRAITFDPVNSHGKSSFIVNALNLTLFTGIGETAQFNASVDLVPRARDVSDPNGVFVGDYIDVKLAYGEWRPRIGGDDPKVDLMLQAGKFDSVLGYEYRSIESPDRLGVTPSLICRYTCGRPLGLKARAQFLNKTLIANVAVTNGSHFHEGFPFANEIDSNHMKTVAGRLSYSIAGKVEVGVSGAWGAQDFQPSNDVHQWHAGADLHAEIKDLELTAEFVHGRAKGETSTVGPRCDVAPCLKYYGGYLLAGYRLSNVFVPYFRTDFRDAMHWSGASFVYISQATRFTLGVRAEIGTRVILKAEGTLNREMTPEQLFGGDATRIPTIPNDVVTSSLVIKY
jgi:hypothetical protein